MKIKYKYIAFSLFALTAFTGCLPEDKTEYKGDTLVEFKNPTLGMYEDVLDAKGIVISPATQVQDVLSKGILINKRTADTVLVQLVGPQRSSPTTVTYALKSGNTAIEGTHYTFATPGARTVVIPANSSVGYLIVKPIANSIATVGQRLTLGVTMISVDGAKISPNYSSFDYSLKR